MLGVSCNSLNESFEWADRTFVPTDLGAPPDGCVGASSWSQWLSSTPLSTTDSLDLLLLFRGCGCERGGRLGATYDLGCSPC